MIRLQPAEDHGLALDVIKTDGGTQSRALLNDQVVSDYAEAIKAGATFPPIVVFYDGKKHWLADGFHRFHAYQKAGRTTVDADVRQGTRRDAILHSVGANETHGLRRTNADKRRAVITLLSDPEWVEQSERWIAGAAKVSHTYVQKIRAEYLATLPEKPDDRQVERGSSTYVMQTANIGAKPDVRENRTTAPASPKALETKGSRPLVDEIPASGHQSEEITSETVVPQGVDGGAGPEKPVEEITPDRDLVAEILTLWTLTNADQKAIIRAAIGITNSPSTVPAVEAVAIPQASQAATATNYPDPQTPVVATADQAHQASQISGAKSDVPHVVSQGGLEPVAHCGHAVQETAKSQQGRNKPASGKPASVNKSKPFVLRPHCLKPDLCAGSGANHCHACKKAMAEGEAA